MLENDLEEHTHSIHDKKEQQCESCPMTYTSHNHIKRHIWRAHTQTECNLCDLVVESRQKLKHHKENIHKMTKQIDCKYANEGKCIDGEECLFYHGENIKVVEHKEPENIIEAPLQEKCQKCPKGYKTLFEVKRHDWRSHEQVDCRLCGQVYENREELENHKQNNHGITKLRECKFWASGRCVDGIECLFTHDSKSYTSKGSHTLGKHKEVIDTNIQLYCKSGLKCPRTCGIDQSGHKKVKDIPCKFADACNRNNCHFKHKNVQIQGFQGNPSHTKKP